MVWYLIVIYIYFNNNEITFAGHIYSVKMNISPFLYWYLKILKHFIKFSFSYFFTLKSQFKRIWTSLTLILSSKVVCIWPHWRPTKAIYFVLSKKRIRSFDVLLNRRKIKTCLHASIKVPSTSLIPYKLYVNFSNHRILILLKVRY